MKLTFSDLLIAAAIVDWWDANHHPPPYQRLLKMMNQMIEDEQIPMRLANQQKANWIIIKAIDRMCLLRLVEAIEPQNYEPIIPEPGLHELFEVIGKEWRNWPAEIPIMGNTLDLANARSIQESI